MWNPSRNREPPPAGASQSLGSSLQNEGGFKWADFHGVTHLSHRDDGTRSQWRCCKVLGRCLTTPSIFVTQYCRHHLPEEPSSPVAPKLPSFIQDEIHFERKAWGNATAALDQSFPQPVIKITKHDTLCSFWVISVFRNSHSIPAIITVQAGDAN